MAIYHLHISNGSKAKGKSAGKRFAYVTRSGDYERHRDQALHVESAHLPTWAENAEEFWRAADELEAKNGRVYREIEFALPRELSPEQRQELAQDFAKELTHYHSLPYTLALHEGHGENPHAHLLFCDRADDGIERSREQYFKRAKAEMPEAGGARKVVQMDGPQWVAQVRQLWGECANVALEQAQQRERIDHRSYEARGIELTPQIHLGVEAAAMARRGIETERLAIYRQIEACRKVELDLMALHREAKQLKHELKLEAQELKAPQEIPTLRLSKNWRPPEALSGALRQEEPGDEQRRDSSRTNDGDDSKTRRSTEARSREQRGGQGAPRDVSQDSAGSREVAVAVARTGEGGGDQPGEPRSDVRAQGRNGGAASAGSREIGKDQRGVQASVPDVARGDEAVSAAQRGLSLEKDVADADYRDADVARGMDFQASSGAQGRGGLELAAVQREPKTEARTGDVSVERQAPSAGAEGPEGRQGQAQGQAQALSPLEEQLRQALEQMKAQNRELEASLAVQSSRAPKVVQEEKQAPTSMSKPARNEGLEVMMREQQLSAWMKTQGKGLLPRELDPKEPATVVHHERIGSQTLTLVVQGQAHGFIRNAEAIEVHYERPQARPKGNEKEAQSPEQRLKPGRLEPDQQIALYPRPGEAMRVVVNPQQARQEQLELKRELEKEHRQRMEKSRGPSRGRDR